MTSVLWDMTLLRWVSGPDVSTEHVTSIFKISRYVRFFAGQNLRDGAWLALRILESICYYTTTQRVATLTAFSALNSVTF
jgi:hypothetical protein